MKHDETFLFESMAIPKAVAKLAVPTMISQLITIIYNLADTYFIGRLGDPVQVAAVNLCLPMMLAYTAMANLFGIGGASLISRALGRGDRGLAERAGAFCVWGGAAASAVFALAVFFLRRPLLLFMGADEATYPYAEQYLIYAVAAGGLFTAMNPLMSHLVRAEGSALSAGAGMSIGAFVNILLDPVFILSLGMNTAGAAIATMIGNMAAVGYYLGYVVLRRRTTVLRLRPARGMKSGPLAREILLVGLPSCLLSLLSTVSNLVTNKLMAAYGAQALAGIGIAKKINLTAFALTQGLGQGVLPLIGYNFAQGNRQRVRGSVTCAAIVAAGVSAVCMAAALIAPAGLVGLFIGDAGTVAYGSAFLRTICLAMPTSAFLFLAVTYFQAVGRKGEPLAISLLRKGTTDVALMLILGHAAGVMGIVWATPVADTAAVLVAAGLLKGYSAKRKREEGRGSQ